MTLCDDMTTLSDHDDVMNPSCVQVGDGPGQEWQGGDAGQAGGADQEGGPQDRVSDLF